MNILASNHQQNQAEEKCKSAYLIETKASFSVQPKIVTAKRNNRYFDKSYDKELPTSTPKTISSRPKQKKSPKNPTTKKTTVSVDKSGLKSPYKINDKFDNIFAKNQNYLLKNKNNYEETLKKITDNDINDTSPNVNNKNYYSPVIRLQNKEIERSEKKSLFENAFTLALHKKNDNYEESLGKIESLYKKNDMAIRDYIKIKDNLNFVCLVIYFLFQKLIFNFKVEKPYKIKLSTTFLSKALISLFVCM